MIAQRLLRPTGSEGNRLATSFFLKQVRKYGWNVQSTRFKAMNWEEEGVDLIVDGKRFVAFPSPYSLGCDLEGEFVSSGDMGELEKLDCRGKVLLLHGSLAQEQLMPKNFVFYNPPEHRTIIRTLEEKDPAAILCATSRNAALAGGVYPFPLIEDGDFDIPSVYFTEEIGQELIDQKAVWVQLVSKAYRELAEGFNIVATKGQKSKQRVVITAHIDAKKGTPGAIDNGTGVVVLLLLAELLADYSGDLMIELVPFNGEDYYAASGQMLYLEQNQTRFNDILLNINIDGAGFHQGPSAISLFDLPTSLEKVWKEIIEINENIVEGLPWYQGDHSIFLQQGVPAVAVSSKWFIDHVDQQDITHTPKDHPEIVDCQRIVEVALAIHEVFQRLSEKPSG